MGYSELFGLFSLAGMFIVLMLIGVLAFFQHRRKRLLTQRAAAIRKQAALEQAATKREAAARAAAQRLFADRIAAEKAAADGGKWLAARRITQEQFAREKSAVELALDEWAVAEQAEADRANVHHAQSERRAADATDLRLRAVEDAIAEWMQAEEEGYLLTSSASGKKAPAQPHTRVVALHQQVDALAESVRKEMDDLEFIRNRIEAGVDILPLEFQQTIDEWKEGLIFRSSSFDDLKRKFRCKAYSIEDGYEAFYLYTQWLAQQHQKIIALIRLLGVGIDKGDSLPAALDEIAQRERAKGLEMDMEIIFVVRDLHALLEQLAGMETLLQTFEAVCRKRSNQIIAPAWEAKGLL